MKESNVEQVRASMTDDSANVWPFPMSTERTWLKNGMKRCLREVSD